MRNLLLISLRLASVVFSFFVVYCLYCYAIFNHVVVAVPHPDLFWGVSLAIWWLIGLLSWIFDLK